MMEDKLNKPRHEKMIVKPNLYCNFNNTSEDLIKFYGGTDVCSSGYYIKKIHEKSILNDKGLKNGDILCEFGTEQQMYKIDNYRYPTTEQGLSALVSKPSGARRWRGPYTEKNKLQDPWGNEFSYESDGKTFKIISPGIDGSVGNEDDVTYPREEESE